MISLSLTGNKTNSGKVKNGTDGSQNCDVQSMPFGFVSGGDDDDDGGPPDEHSSKLPRR